MTAMEMRPRKQAAPLPDSEPGPARMPLTETQADVLKFIVQFLTAHWRQPTLREIAVGTGGKSHPHAVHETVKRLQRKGWLVGKGAHGHKGLGSVLGCTLSIAGFDEALAAVPLAHRNGRPVRPGACVGESENV